MNKSTMKYSFHTSLVLFVSSKGRKRDLKDMTYNIGIKGKRTKKVKDVHGKLPGNLFKEKFFMNIPK